MTRRFFIKILLGLGFGNFFPKLAEAEKISADNDQTKNFDKIKSETSKKFSVLIFADSQCVDYGVWKKVADFADKNFPDAKLATVIGDLVDNGAADYQWRTFFSAAKNLMQDRIFLPVIGNHECYNLEWKFCLPEGFLKRFETPKIDEEKFQGYFYSFDYGEATFFILNNNFEELDNFLPDLKEVQENWFRREVQKSKKNWKIVLMHKDIFNYAENKFEDIGEIFMSLFDELEIDLVFTGHLHTYRNRGKIFAGKKSAVGTAYILCGRSGDQKYFENLSEIDEVFVPDLKNEPETFLKVDIEKNILNLTCLSSGGEIFDKFTLKKF